MVRDQAQSSTRGGGCLLLAMAAIVIVAAAIAIPTVGQVELGKHAVEKHGNDAVLVRQWVANNAQPWHRWDCPDGRTRIIVPHNTRGYAVMIMLGSHEFTSYFTDDQVYVTHLKEPCKPFVGVAHP